jgi:hypothetical protein
VHRRVETTPRLRLPSPRLLFRLLPPLIAFGRLPYPPAHPSTLVFVVPWFPTLAYYSFPLVGRALAARASRRPRLRLPPPRVPCGIPPVTMPPLCKVSLILCVCFAGSSRGL